MRRRSRAWGRVRRPPFRMPRLPPDLLRPLQMKSAQSDGSTDHFILSYMPRTSETGAGTGESTTLPSCGYNCGMGDKRHTVSPWIVSALLAMLTIALAASGVFQDVSAVRHETFVEIDTSQ